MRSGADLLSIRAFETKRYLNRASNLDIVNTAGKAQSHVAINKAG
jgi:hypothetical protein